MRIGKFIKEHFALAVLTLLLPAGPVRGETYSYRQISTADGLSYNYVTALSLDPYNRLWVGTRNGVNVISNGSAVSYTRVKNASGENDPVSRVVDIISCPTGMLIATSTSLLLFDEPGETWSRLLWEGSDIVAGAIANCPEGVLIFETRRNSLLNLNPDTCELSLIRSFSEKKLSGVRKMAVPSRNRNLLFLISGTEGVFEYDRTKEILTHVDAIPNQIRTSSTYLDAHDNLWLSPANAGVACYDTEDHYALRHSFSKSDSFLTDNDVLCIAEAGGYLYFGTDGGGINVIDREDGWKEVLRTPLLQSVTTLGTDAEGHLLAGTTHNGVIGIRESFIRTLHDEYILHFDARLSNSTVLSMHEDPDSGIWLGTDGGGLNLYEEATGAVRQFPSTFGKKVNSICSYGPDNLLLMLYNEGMFLFNKRTETLAPFKMAGMPRLDFSSGQANFLKIIGLENGDILFVNGEENNWLFRAKTKDFLSFATAKSPQGTPELLSNFHCGKDYTLALGRYGIYEINNNSLTIKNLYQGGGVMKSLLSALPRTEPAGLRTKMGSLPGIREQERFPG